jgi:hypothetical protein
VFIPHYFRRHGPHALLRPIAGDGFDFGRGPIRDKAENSNSPEGKPLITRIMTRSPHPRPSSTTNVGLASLLDAEQDDRFPTGNETDVSAISMQKMRPEQALDSTCKRLMLLTENSGMYDLNEVGVLVLKSPYDSSVRS